MIQLPVSRLVSLGVGFTAKVSYLKLELSRCLEGLRGRQA